MPTVPGIQRDKPAPQPSATQCAACETMKRQVARTGGGPAVAGSAEGPAAAEAEVAE